MGVNFQTPRTDEPLVNINGMVTRSWYNYLGTRNGMNIITGNGIPAIIPKNVGDEYLDLTAKKMYKAFGVTSISDWIILN